MTGRATASRPAKRQRTDTETVPGDVDDDGDAGDGRPARGGARGRPRGRPRGSRAGTAPGRVSSVASGRAGSTGRPRGRPRGSRAGTAPGRASSVASGRAGSTGRPRGRPRKVFAGAAGVPTGGMGNGSNTTGGSQPAAPGNANGNGNGTNSIEPTPPAPTSTSAPTSTVTTPGLTTTPTPTSTSMPTIPSVPTDGGGNGTTVPVNINGTVASAMSSSVAASRPGKTQTLPANFNGDLNTLPDFNPNAQELPSSQIAGLPATFTNSLLAYAAARDPYINSILAHQHDLQRARERARVISFSHYSQSAWEMLGSEAYERKLGKMLDTILKTVKDAGGNDCSYGTRRNAFQAMAEIMLGMVTAANNEIGGYGAYDDDYYEAKDMDRRLLEMMDYFDDDELAQLHEKGWTNQVRELQLADGNYSLFERLDKVLDMLERGR